MASQDAIESLASAVGCDEDTARHALEAAGGDADLAAATLLEEAPIEGPPARREAASLAAEAAARREAALQAGGSAEAANAAASRRSRPSSSSRIAGFSDLAGEDDEGADDVNEYYAGGEKSGQVVRGAPEPPRDAEGLFDAARRAGAELGSEEDLAPRASRPRAFKGRGRTLAGGVVEAAEAPGGAAEPEPRRVVVAFYEDGTFTVDEGEPRRLDDPAERPFVGALMSGEIPPELDPGDPRIHVDVNLVRRDGPYQRPRGVRAFAGAGNRLGGAAADEVDVEPGDRGAGPAPAAPGVPASTWSGPDESKPVASVSVRLPDGSRLTGRFNPDQTVADVRAFVASARPDLPANGTLAVAFPPKPLSDDTQTIEAAGLANAVAVLKAA